MAKDIVARALALDKSSGGDSYTKAETDALLDGKADLVNGVVPISQIPPAAIEREVPVADDAARFALTTADVQLGDTVRVVETGLMYLVVNTDHLDTEAGYQVYVAGRAAEAVADQYGNTIDTTYAPQSTTYTKTEVDTALAEKVDKETGKGLSTNDFTDTDKADLAAALATANAAAPQSTTYTKTEVDTSQAAQDTRLDWLERNIETIRVMMNAVLYGYRVDKNDSNPETRVSYMYDAVGMTPARMDYTTGIFDYGSWGNAWFITGNKPVALKYDGTVDYELNPNDYTKKTDGTASDVSDSSYTGNFMASIPTVWIKRWSDDSYDYYAISNKQITPDFYADAHDAGDGTINPYIYLPMFKGAIIDSKMRSIAGVTPQGNTSGSEEQTAAEACGSGWQIWDFSKHELISDLLTLISRSTDSQGAFGQGDTNTYDTSDTTTYGKLTTGTSGAGQFWGTSDETHHVKVFHIEDFWGNRWDRCLGLNLIDNQYVYKLVRPYALNTDNTYTSSGLTAPGEGCQKSQTVGRFGTLPKTVGGSSTTYECDYIYINASGVRLGLFGGRCSSGAYCGSRCLDLNNASGFRGWGRGGSPCFSPIPTIPHKDEIDAIMN